MAVDYNDLLYEKAQKEYDDLIAELKELPSEQVIERAYEKVIKENILCILEDSQRDQKEAKALYLEKYPLDRAYQDWLKSDVSGTAMLRSTHCVKSALRKVCTRQPRRFTTSSLSHKEEPTTAAI